MPIMQGIEGAWQVDSISPRSIADHLASGELDRGDPAPHEGLKWVANALHCLLYTRDVLSLMLPCFLCMTTKRWCHHDGGSGVLVKEVVKHTCTTSVGPSDGAVPLADGNSCRSSFSCCCKLHPSAKALSISLEATASSDILSLEPLDNRRLYAFVVCPSWVAMHTCISGSNALMTCLAEDEAAPCCSQQQAWLIDSVRWMLCESISMSTSSLTIAKLSLLLP